MDYKVADISNQAMSKISEYEKELQQITDKNIVLVAYQETDN